jgi:TonB-dependent starch-binding outer membrane protein SusC
MIKKILLFLIILKISSVAFAQNRQVSGKVTDEKSGETLIGVSVVVKGAKVYAQTDANGMFKLTLPGPGSFTLQVSYLGFETKEVPVNSESVINIALRENVSSLDEVVVIGYGTARRGDLAGAVGSIKGKDIERTPVSNIAEAITGRIAGVQVTTLDGSPGSDIIIRVRGGNSITQDNSPLYIVDGFIVDNISNIAPTDIESIDILKDAASTAIYGSRGANGVVIVTTKTPKAGKTTISYNGYTQAKNFPRKLDVLSPYEFALAQYEYATLRGTTSGDFTNFTKFFGNYDDLELYKYQKGTDWQEELFGQPVMSQQHNISLTGGTEKTKMSFNSTYNKDEGIMAGSGAKRLYFNFKMNHEISSKLKLDLAARYSDNIIDGAGTAGGASVRVGDGIQTRPINGLADQIIFDPNSVTTGDDDYEQFITSLVDPISLAAQDYRRRINRDFSVNGALGWNVLSDLSLRSELAVTLRNGSSKRYWGPLTGESRNVGNNQPLGELNVGASSTYRWINTANYKLKETKSSKFNFLVGQEIQTTSGATTFNRAKNFDVTLQPQELFANMGLGVSESLQTIEERGEDLLSFFGRTNYTFKDKYILYLTLRADGSSKFAPGKRWGYFPSASFAWRASDEPFIKNIEVISDLKFRLSYGEAGNNRIPNNAWRFSFLPNANRPYGAGDISQTYYNVSNSSLPNPNLRWETTVSRNLGFDFGLFNGRLSGTLDAYKNTTKDLIVGNEIPPQTGFPNQLINIGQTSNRGVELSLNGTIISNKNFRLTGSFNIGKNTPKIDKLDGNDVRSFESNWAGTDLKGRDDYRLMAGSTIGLMYGFVNDGFYTTDDFESYNPTTRAYELKDGVPSPGGLMGGIIGTRPGTMKLKDLDGDGLITAENDRMIIGSAVPKHSGGFGFNATFKAFDFSTFFNWVYGNDVYNTGRIQFNMLYRSSYGNMLERVSYDNRFKYIDGNGALVTGLAELAELNKDAKMWSPFSMGNASPVFNSDAVEDGSFLRLNNVTLGYTLPKALTTRVGISSLRLYGTVYNALLFTNYSGYDPEVSATRSGAYAALTPGVDFSGYPKSRTFTLGLNLNF